MLQHLLADFAIPVGIPTALITIATFILKNILTKHIETKYDKILKNLDRQHALELEAIKSQYSLELESFKNTLEKDRILFGIQNSELQTRRADKIEDLYRKINEMSNQANVHKVFPKEDYHPWNYYHKVFDEFKVTDLYFSEAFISKYNKLISNFQQMTNKMDILRGKDSDFNEYLRHERNELANFFSDEIPTLKKEIRMSFKKLLGVTEE